MRAVSMKSFAIVTELPTTPVANRTTAVSSTSRTAVRRMRRVRTRWRACSRYSTRPAESGSSFSERPRKFLRIRFALSLVIYAFQEQALRGQGRPGQAAVPAGQDARHGVRVQPPGTGLAQGPRQDAHHII